MRSTFLFLAFFLIASMSACGERPPRLDPQGKHAYNADPGPSALRDRTLKQGEPQ